MMARTRRHSGYVMHHVEAGHHHCVFSSLDDFLFDALSLISFFLYLRLQSIFYQMFKRFRVYPFNLIPLFVTKSFALFPHPPPLPPHTPPHTPSSFALPLFLPPFKSHPPLTNFSPRIPAVHFPFSSSFSLPLPVLLSPLALPSLIPTPLPHVYV